MTPPKMRALRLSPIHHAPNGCAQSARRFPAWKSKGATPKGATRAAGVLTALSLFAPSAHASTVDGMLTNVVNLMLPFWSLLGTWAMIIGLAFTIGSIVTFSMSKDPEKRRAGILAFIAGILLLSITAFMNTMSSLVTLGKMDGVMSYIPPGNSGTTYDLALRLAIYTVQLVGFWALIKSIRLMKESAYDRKAWNSAMIHLWGGLASVNIVTLVTSVAITVGGAFQTAVMKILNG